LSLKNRGGLPKIRSTL